MSPGKGSFQLLRKLRENFPLQETRFVVTLRLKIPDGADTGIRPYMPELNMALDFE